MVLGKTEWVARPLPALKGGLAGAFTALFSTRYAVYEGPYLDKDPISHVSYHPLKDEIVIQAGETKWKTESSTFGPLTFRFEERTYEIQEKMTGRFAVARDGAVVAEGQARFRSVIVTTYPDEMQGFFGQLAIGLLIRTLFSELGL